MRYAIIEFPNLDIGLEHYLKAKELFSTRCSCLNRSENNPKVSLLLCLNDIPDHLYTMYIQTLPATSLIGTLDLV